MLADNAIYGTPPDAPCGGIPAAAHRTLGRFAAHCDGIESGDRAGGATYTGCHRHWYYRIDFCCKGQRVGADFDDYFLPSVWVDFFSGALLGRDDYLSGHEPADGHLVNNYMAEKPVSRWQNRRYSEAHPQTCRGGGVFWSFDHRGVLSDSACFGCWSR